MSFKRGSIKVGSSFLDRIHVCSIDAIITKKEIGRPIQANKAPEYDDFSDETDEDDVDHMYPCDPSTPLVWEISSCDPGLVGVPRPNIQPAPCLGFCELYGQENVSFA
jgi:hypothetical protein